MKGGGRRNHQSVNKAVVGTHASEPSGEGKAAAAGVRALQHL